MELTLRARIEFTFEDALREKENLKGSNGGHETLAITHLIDNPHQFEVLNYLGHDF